MSRFVVFLIFVGGFVLLVFLGYAAFAPNNPILLGLAEKIGDPKACGTLFRALPYPELPPYFKVAISGIPDDTPVQIETGREYLMVRNGADYIGAAQYVTNGSVPPEPRIWVQENNAWVEWVWQNTLDGRRFCHP